MLNLEEDQEIILEMIKELGLDINWLIAVVSLSAQEIAVKRKLIELGESYGEDDFQKLAENLIKSMQKRNIKEPNILLSIARSYRRIRAEIMHNPYKTMINAAEATAILYNTNALIKSLFKDSGSLNIQKFVDSIMNSSQEEKVAVFSELDKEAKENIFTAIMDRIALLRWEEVGFHAALFSFLEVCLKNETDMEIRNELFEIVVRKTLLNPIISKERLLLIIAEFTSLDQIKSFIKKKGLIEPLIAEYEASYSFEVAGINSRIMLNLVPVLDNTKMSRVIHIATSNKQISNSWDAHDSFKKLLALYPDKITKEEHKILEDFLSEK